MEVLEQLWLGARRRLTKRVEPLEEATTADGQALELIEIGDRAR